MLSSLVDAVSGRAWYLSGGFNSIRWYRIDFAGLLARRAKHQVSLLWECHLGNEDEDGNTTGITREALCQLHCFLWKRFETCSAAKLHG